MPVVYLPLGSKLAFGKMGDLFVFQGTTVRAWTVPYDPRTAAQLDQRHLFADVTKMLRAMGPWPRAVCKALFGARWFTGMTGSMLADVDGYWSAAASWWAWNDQAYQTEWSAAAPYPATWNEPGFIFFCCHYALSKFVGESGEIFDGYIHIDGDGNVIADYSAQALAWWLRSLDGVVLPGLYDNDGGFVTWPVAPDLITGAAQAYGGSYLQIRPAMYGDGEFYFYGVQFRILYKQSSDGKPLFVNYQPDGNEQIQQYAAVETWQNVWSSPIMAKGLHHVALSSAGASYCNIDAIEIVGKASQTSIPKVNGQTLEIGVIELAEQVEAPTTPSAGVVKVYSKADGVLRVLKPSGVENVAILEKATSAEVTSGTDNEKFTTPKALKDAGIVPDYQHDHGGLAGLGDDDHSQYFNQTRGDARYLQSIAGAWPVGSVFISVVATSPATLLGFGTWAAFGAGRVLVGRDATQTEFDVVEETGGAKTVTLGVTEMPTHTHVQDAHNHNQNSHNHNQDAHNHNQNSHNHLQDAHLHTWQQRDTPAGGTSVRAPQATTAAGTNYDRNTSSVTPTNQAATAVNQETTATNQSVTASNQSATATNQNAGGGLAHNNLQPYIVVYMWKRTA